MTDTLHPGSREWFAWPVESNVTPTPAIELSIDDGQTWHDTEPGPDGGSIHKLIAGPEATSNPVGTLVLPAGRISAFCARAVDNPEVVIREAGFIRVMT